MLDGEGSRFTMPEYAPNTDKFWGDIFEKNNVSAFINGHDHHYHRYEADGVPIITSGGGGAGLYDGDPKFAPGESILYKKVNHFITVDVGLKEVTLKAIDVEGNQIETFSTPRRKTDYKPSNK